MKILHLIDNVEKVNFGIWNAALINSSLLLEKGVKSYALYPDSEQEFTYPDVSCLSFSKLEDISEILLNNDLDAATTIVISHGCWRWPSKLGFTLKNQGYKWIAVPHGMLEPWSMSQKALKKKIYWALFEKRYLKSADKIRAVGKPEYDNLVNIFAQKTFLVHNGVDFPKDLKPKSTEKLVFLFMARLHKKKGILPLVQAWKKSRLNDNVKFELRIAGPDDGELSAINRELEQVTNIHYLGAVYGDKKNDLLAESHVYILPSLSEGFPSSVVEAMGFGLLPLISEGCNFPEAFEQKVAINVEIDTIETKLNKIADLNSDEIAKKGFDAHVYVSETLTNQVITDKLFDFYSSI